MPIELIDGLYNDDVIGFIIVMGLEGCEVSSEPCWIVSHIYEIYITDFAIESPVDDRRF
jgi:hypothetical protein